jgi:regulator of protease activity HflC (stomatin/prohibitin superfamily)
MAWIALFTLGLALSFVITRTFLAAAARQQRAHAERDGGKFRGGEPDYALATRVFSWVSIIVSAAGLILFLISSIRVVNPGTVGVKIVFGSADNEVLPEGLHLVNPFAVVKTMSTRTLAYTMSATSGEGKVKGDDSLAVLSKDGMTLNMDLTVTHRLNAKFAVHIYRCYGRQYEDAILRPQVQEVVRTAAKQYTAQEVYAARRDELATNILVLLRRNVKALTTSGCKALNGAEGLLIEQALLRNITLPIKVKAAIEDKLEAEQRAQKMQFVLERERQEAERKRVEATGIQQFQEIVRKGIDERLLRWKGIEATVQLATSPNAKLVIIGGRDGLPVLLNQDGTASPIVGEKK